MDRLLGYGLKYNDSPQHTHLSWKSSRPLVPAAPTPVDTPKRVRTVGGVSANSDTSQAIIGTTESARLSDRDGDSNAQARASDTRGSPDAIGPAGVSGVTMLFVVLGVVLIVPLYAFGVRRLLGLRLSPLRALIAGIVALACASPIIKAIGGSIAKHNGKWPFLPALWFVILGVAIALLVGMLVVVILEALVADGTMPGRSLAAETRVRIPVAVLVLDGRKVMQIIRSETALWQRTTVAAL